MDADRPMSFAHARRRRGLISSLLAFAGFVFIMAGVALGGYEGYRWLQTGQTHQLLVGEALHPTLPNQVHNWVTQPRSWYGLHRVVLWILQIPFFVLLMFVGLLIFLASTA